MINVCSPRQIHLEKGLLINTITIKLYEIIKITKNVIAFEEAIRLYMYDLFTSVVVDMFSSINKR